MRKSLTIACMLLPCLAQAAGRPPEIPASIHADAPVGSGQLSKLFIHVYDASFWSDAGATLKPPYALSITYDMDFTKDELIGRTVKELKHVAPLSDSQLEQYATQLHTIWPDIHQGDRITAFTPDGKQTQFYHNGKKTGAVADAGFTPAFFGIWLSAKSSEPEMRKELLALGSAE